MAASTPKDEVATQPQREQPAGKKSKDPKDDAGKKYIVKSRIKHNGETHLDGDQLTLSDDHAEPLLQAGAIVGA